MIGLHFGPVLGLLLEGISAQTLQSLPGPNPSPYPGIPGFLALALNTKPVASLGEVDCCISLLCITESAKMTFVRLQQQSVVNSHYLATQSEYQFNQYYIGRSLPSYNAMQWVKTSQELRMLSSVTINCQITKIVMNSGSQLSEL